MARTVWYNPTTWLERVTKVGPTNLNKIETGVLNAHSRLDALSFNATDFGAKADGATDDSAAVQAAITAAQSAGGGTVYLPPGTIKCNSSIGTSGQHIRIVGAGRGGSPVSGTGTILLFPNAGDCLFINGGASNAYYCSVENLTIKKAAPTSGYAITLDSHNYCSIRNVAIVNSYSGVRIGTAAGVLSASLVIEDLVGNCDPAGIGIDVQGQCNGIWLTRVNLIATTQGSSGKGISLPSGASSGNLDTLIVTDCLFQRFAFGIYAQPSNASSSVLDDVFINKSIFDQCTLYGLFIQPTNLGRVVSWTLTDSWFTSQQQQAVIIDGGVSCVDGVQFNGCRILDSFLQGVLVTGNPINVELNNCKVSYVSRTGSGVNAAVQFAGTSKWRVRGCKIGSYGQTPSNFASYGIEIDAGCADFVVENNDLNGNVTGAIFDGTTTGARRYVRNNSGYNPRGPLTPPAVPATTVAQTNNFTVEVDVYVTAGAGSTCGVKLDAVAMATLPASGIGVFRVPPGQTITLTYTSAPTWAWYGN